MPIDLVGILAETQVHLKLPVLCRSFTFTHPLPPMTNIVGFGFYYLVSNGV